MSRMCGSSKEKRDKNRSKALIRLEQGDKAWVCAKCRGMSHKKDRLCTPEKVKQDLPGKGAQGCGETPAASLKT